MGDIETRTTGLNDVLLKLDRIFTPMLNDLQTLVDHYSRNNIFKRVYMFLKMVTVRLLIAFRIKPPNWLLRKSKVSYSKFVADDQKRFERILKTALMIKHVSEVDLIDQNGLMTEQSAIVLKEANDYLRIQA
jgi:hypothetical protein